MHHVVCSTSHGLIKHGGACESRKKRVEEENVSVVWLMLMTKRDNERHTPRFIRMLSGEQREREERTVT